MRTTMKEDRGKRRQMGRGTSGGFTLVEAIVASVMAAVIILAVSKAMSTSLHNAALLKQKAQASAVAQLHLEEAIATGDWLNGGDESGDDPPNFDVNQPAMYHWDVTTSDFSDPEGTGNLHQVTCQVTWTSHLQSEARSGTTLMDYVEKVQETAPL